MDKSAVRMEPQEIAVERRFRAAPRDNTTQIKAAFDRIRAQLAQEAEQRSRPVARIYSGFRAVKA